MKLRSQFSERGDNVFDRSTPGFSEAARRVDESLDEARSHWLQTITSQRGTLEATFRQLAFDWKQATEYQSSAERIAMHPSYQRIIGMGREVLPLILNDLEETHDPWFWALAAITGENPVPEGDRGYIDRMVKAWVLWGVRKNVLRG